MNRREFVLTGSLALTTFATFAGSVRSQEKKQYVCPPCGCSHDGVAHNEPGNCPVCNMAMIEKTPAMSELTGIPRFLSSQIRSGPEGSHGPSICPN